MSISSRLKQVIESQNLSIKAFSEQVSIPYRSIQNYLREEREPNVEALVKLNHAMNIDINWLLTGKGEMLLSAIKSRELSEQENKLVKNYHQCNEKIQDAIQNIMDGLIEANR